MHICDRSRNSESEASDARLDRVVRWRRHVVWPTLDDHVWLGVLVAIIVVLVRWLGGADGSARRASDILDDRYAHGEIEREEYMKRKHDIAGG